MSPLRREAVLARASEGVGRAQVPVRIQRRRTKGFNLQAASPNGLPVVYVGRPTIYGSPFIRDTRAASVEAFRFWWSNRGRGNNPFPEEMTLFMGAKFQTEPNPLRGKNLACWCPLDQPCHADVLLEIANG